MVTFLIIVAVYAIIFVAGRAHSRHLDKLEGRFNQLYRGSKADS